MSTNILVSLAVNTLIVILPLFGIHVGNQNITDAAQTLVTVITGFVIFFEHKKATDTIASHGL